MLADVSYELLSLLPAGYISHVSKHDQTRVSAAESQRLALHHHSSATWLVGIGPCLQTPQTNG